MKYVRTSDGKIYKSYSAAFAEFCGPRVCRTCPVPNNTRGDLLPEGCRCCVDYRERYPEEANAIMGIEKYEEQQIEIAASEILGLLGGAL